MTNSLLDKISRSAKDGVITKWQNGQVGEISIYKAIVSIGLLTMKQIQMVTFGKSI